MKFMKLGSKPDSFQRDGNKRCVATELATDFTINVGDVKFYLHKFPLLSKSARMQKLVSNNNEENNDEVHIPDIPGGASAFEICAKFCYGMTVTLNACNVVAARCAAEYLEMHEAVEKGNLIYKIEVFLDSTICRSWKDSIIVLQATRSLFPWSEELKVVARCIDSIASRASVEPTKVDWSYSYNRKKLPSENGTDPHWNGIQRHITVPKDWWVEDLCELEIDFYKRVIISIKSKGKMSCDLIGEALKAYALKRLPAFDRHKVHGNEAARKRSLVETIIWLLPSKKGSVSCTFLLKLLKAGILLDISEMAKRELVKRIAVQLDEAAAVDLLMPASVSENGLYDIDLVQNIVHEFLVQEPNARTGHSVVPYEQLPDESRTLASVSYASQLAVANVVDGYLVEIAHDPSLPLAKFIELAEMVPDTARPVHDGLYQAIDKYLKEHSGTSKGDKKRLCNLMDCKKLSAEACTHAVQNDRLPLRVVVQVLFFEQVRAGASGGIVLTDMPCTQRTLLPESGLSHGSSRTATTNTEDDSDGTPITSAELRTIKGELTSVRVGVDKTDGRDAKDAEKVRSKVRGILKSKKIFIKLWSNKEKSENSSSDTSESPVSTHPAETKSTSSRNGRHSVS